MPAQETVVLIISFIISVILGAIIIPVLKKLKVGQIEREDGPESHLKKQGTPTMGGVIMMISIVITTVIAYIYMRYSNMQLEEANKMIPLLLITLGFGIVGFVDDFKKLVLKKTEGLKPRYKMIGLLIISALYVMYLVFGLKNGTDLIIPFVENVITLPVYIYIPFAIIVMLRNNKCSKFNRWDRWIVIKCLCNNNNDIINNRNTFRNS